MLNRSIDNTIWRPKNEKKYKELKLEKNCEKKIKQIKEINFLMVQN